MSSPAGASRGVVLAAVGLVAAAAGLAAGVLLTGALLRPAVPAEGSVDVGFARDMQVHHDQAVEMAVLVRDRSQDPEVRQVALDILLTQQQQQGQMHGWLSAWGLPLVGSEPPMAWAGDGHRHAAGASDDGRAAMPGLVTAEDMERLSEASGAEADRLFLTLMLPHHEGGVEMARAAVDQASRPEVRALADAIIRSQEAEIGVLTALLDGRGGASAP